MSSTSRVLLGLAAGLGAGLALRAVEHPFAAAAVTWIEPAGALWLNALRMTVVPLVVSLVITGIAAASDAAATGRAALRALLIIVLLLSAGAIISVIISPAAFSLFPNSSSEALRGSATVPPSQMPPISQWITGIIPSNPIKAAADGAMLSLLVFALLFGFAMTRIDPQRRQRLIEFFQAIAETMMVIVRWVLWLAPIGVFALVLPMAARTGLGMVGGIASYLFIDCGMCALTIVAMYPLAVIVGRVPLRRFARAAAPAQAVAASTQSSLASLPAMIDGAQSHLKLPQRVTNVVLPLAVAVFRITSPVGYMVGAAFVAWLYGIHLSPLQYAAGAAVGVIVSMGSIGLPGQVTLVGNYIPIFQVMGLPLDPLGLLLAVDTIPDVFRTVGNVTADLTVTSIVARDTKAAEESSAQNVRSLAADQM
jgi:Na+/H+-dicarboxylate symporter